jgi:predicted helicase
MEFDENQVRTSLYRPFTRRFLYFSELLAERRYQFPQFFPTTPSEQENRVIAVSDIGFRAGTYSCLVASGLVDIHVCASVDAHQCFPFYVYDEDGGNRQENVTNWALRRFREHYRNKRISKWDIFYYVYGVLHHPGYRERLAENLKRALPRIPLAPDFRAFAAAGQKLARLHLDYEKLDPWPLEWIETPSVPLSYRVDDKMRLSKDRTALKVNGSLTLAHIPPEVFRYRLGNRSALDWVIDQYHVSEDKRSGIVSDPNRPDDPEYIVRLIGQVVRVSIETVTIVGALPADFGAGRQGLSDSKMRADVSDESEEG